MKSIDIHGFDYWWRFITLIHLLYLELQEHQPSKQSLSWSSEREIIPENPQSWCLIKPMLRLIFTWDGTAWKHNLHRKQGLVIWCKCWSQRYVLTSYALIIFLPYEENSTPGFILRRVLWVVTRSGDVSVVTLLDFLGCWASNLPLQYCLCVHQILSKKKSTVFLKAGVSYLVYCCGVGFQECLDWSSVLCLKNSWGGN